MDESFLGHTPNTVKVPYLHEICNAEAVLQVKEAWLAMKSEGNPYLGKYFLYRERNVILFSLRFRISEYRIF